MSKHDEWVLGDMGAKCPFCGELAVAKPDSFGTPIVRGCVHCSGLGSIDGALALIFNEDSIALSSKRKAKVKAEPPPDIPPDSR